MNIEEIKEYRKDGSLMYECTKRILSKSEEHLFDRRIGLNGNTFIRIKHATKYNKDGSIQWRLIYNDSGEVIGNANGSIKSFNFSK